MDSTPSIRLGRILSFSAIIATLPLTASAVLVGNWGLETGFQNATLTNGADGSFSTTVPTGNAAPRTTLASPISFGSADVGKSVTFSGTVVLSGAPTSDIQFRFGLYDYNGNTPGTDAGTTWTGADTTGWLGYTTEIRSFTNAASAATRVIGRNAAATNAWLSSNPGTSVYTPTVVGTPVNSGTASAGGTFNFSLTLTRINATDVGISYSFIQTGGTGSMSVTGSYTDTAGDSRALDNIEAVGFLLNANTGSGTFSNVDVSVIPEPSTFAALAGFAVLGFVTSRRRRSSAQR